MKTMGNSRTKGTRRTSSQRIAITYVAPHCAEDKDFCYVASELGSKAVAHHFSKGRSVTIGENGKVVKLYKNNRRVVVKG